ncbi:hypothetical protein M405DRAFT_416964 [Rhizopogon salebrosus TDB-379]|nr:hypothetical protein M405DRAFT_416964 [Rhizopogon salebrosus TDB-379]
MVPAAAVSAIAACRAIIRLKAFNISKQGNIRNNSSLGDRISTPAIGHRSPADPVSFLPSYKTMEPEVHITTERISMNEFGSPQSTTSKSPSDHERDSDGTSIDVDTNYPCPCYKDRDSTVQLPPHIHLGSAV